MKATELRIGNLITHDVYNHERLEKQIENGDHIDQAIRLRAEPIPLTEEWLVKFGLKLHDLDSRDNPFLDNVVGKYRDEGKFKFVISSDDDQHGGWGYYTKEIKHVHQLQNLYFALTGEELVLTK